MRLPLKAMRSPVGVGRNINLLCKTDKRANPDIIMISKSFVNQTIIHSSLTIRQMFSPAVHGNCHTDFEILLFFII